MQQLKVPWLTKRSIGEAVAGVIAGLKMRNRKLNGRRIILHPACWCPRKQLKVRFINAVAPGRWYFTMSKALLAAPSALIPVLKIGQKLPVRSKKPAVSPMCPNRQWLYGCRIWVWSETKPEPGCHGPNHIPFLDLILNIFLYLSFYRIEHIHLFVNFFW